VHLVIARVLSAAVKFYGLNAASRTAAAAYYRCTIRRRGASFGHDNQSALCFFAHASFIEKTLTRLECMKQTRQKEQLG
jgi:hypothetical protein